MEGDQPRPLAPGGLAHRSRHTSKGPFPEWARKHVERPYCQGDKSSEGLRLLRAGDYERAIAAFSEVVGLRPNSDVAYRNRSDAYRRMGRESAAREDAEKARTLRQLRKKELAEQRASELKDQTAEVRRAYEQTVASLTQAISLDPNELDHYRDRAEAYMNLRRRERAETDLRKIGSEIQARRQDSWFRRITCLINVHDGGYWIYKWPKRCRSLGVCLRCGCWREETRHQWGELHGNWAAGEHVHCDRCGEKEKRSTFPI